MLRIALDGPGVVVEHAHVDVEMSTDGACPLGYRHADLDVVRLLRGGEFAPVPALRVEVCVDVPAHVVCPVIDELGEVEPEGLLAVPY